MSSSIDKSKLYEVTQDGWGEAHRSTWLEEQSVKRSYKDEVISKIDALKELFVVEQYGALSYDKNKYPLFLLRTKDWDQGKSSVLITGGVHGYETSGVQGALEFAKNKALDFSSQFNIVVAPCVSPWGYETINRWNPNAVDPNRSFVADSESEEAAQLMKAIRALSKNFLAHIDLHETTDTDNTVFRPALAARDGISQKTWNIPDGFYLVDDTELPQDEFQSAIIKSVEKVTHIALPDEKNELIGEPITQHGVIRYPLVKLGLCTGFTGAKYTTTTEVYPDSPKVDDENCNQAQVAACVGALEFLRTIEG